MQVSIFYSWQSDLPNAFNRGFIQSCVEMAVEEIKTDQIHLEIAIERDTLGVSGTPDISASIYSKIDAATIFIGDISIINSSSEFRKVPNPNVLVELGYAAKSIGWPNVISIFNSDYGKIEDLPFDLRSWRPLVYSIENKDNKTEDKRKLSKALKLAIELILQKEHRRNEIREYIKQQIDKEIMAVSSQLFKVIYGYNKSFTLESIWHLLTLTEDDLNRELFERKYLGFTVLKDWRIFLQRLQDAMNKPFFTQNAEPSYVSSLLKVVRSLETVCVVFENTRLLIDTEQTTSDYRVVDGQKMNPENPTDSYLLLKPLPDNESGVVVDSGTIRKYNISKARNYFAINTELFVGLVMSIRELLIGIESWTTSTGNRLIVDPLTYKF